MKSVEIARARRKVLATELHGGHSADWKKGGNR